MRRTIELPNKFQPVCAQSSRSYVRDWPIPTFVMSQRRLKLLLCNLPSDSGFARLTQVRSEIKRLNYQPAGKL